MIENDVECMTYLQRVLLWQYCTVALVPSKHGFLCEDTSKHSQVVLVAGLYTCSRCAACLFSLPYILSEITSHSVANCATWIAK